VPLFKGPTCISGVRVVSEVVYELEIDEETLRKLEKLLKELEEEEDSNQ